MTNTGSKNKLSGNNWITIKGTLTFGAFWTNIARQETKKCQGLFPNERY